MDEVIAFLKECGVFFLATVDASQGRVRPMGFVMSYSGRMYFCTSNQKNLFKQMKRSPRVEICAFKDGTTLRITGIVGFEFSRDAKIKALEAAPELKKMYSVDDNIFEVFYFKEATAVFIKGDGTKNEIEID